MKTGAVRHITIDEPSSFLSDRPKDLDKPNRHGIVYWDNVWPEEGIQDFSVHSRFIEETKWRYLQQDLAGAIGKTLEVGCGSGHLSSLLARKGYQAFLLDYSLPAVLCARSSFQIYGGRNRKRYVLGNALSLPFAEGTFDVVLSCGLLEHFEDANPVVAEMARVLKKGGLFYADICPKKFSLINVISAMHQGKEGWYEAEITTKEIVHMIKLAGLTLKRLFAGGVLPPRDLPGKGRIRMLKKLERIAIERFPRFWRSFDGTRLGEVLGLYYYVTAVKQ